MVVLLKFFWRDCNALVERRNSSDSARSIVADGHFRALACVPAVREAWRMLMICTYCNPNNRVETLGVDSYEVTGTVTVCHSSPSSIRKMQVLLGVHCQKDYSLHWLEISTGHIAVSCSIHWLTVKLS
jgi:hypothetical protein